MTFTVRPISFAQHREYVVNQSSVSFLQTPEWGAAKPGWESHSLGWFSGSRLIGAGLVLSRRIPRSRSWLAYLPEGPHLSALADGNEAVPSLLEPLLHHLRAEGAFLAKIGPTVPVRRWEAATLKSAIGQPGVERLRDVVPDESFAAGVDLISALRTAGWTQRPDTGAGFGDVQPRYVFQVPLRDTAGSATSEQQLFAHFNQLWRRNVRKAERAGVDVRRGDRSDLARFHPVYVETAIRDGFIPRPLSYFEQMWDALNQPDSTAALSVYLATWNEQTLAATTMIRVGDHAWYSYGASSNAGREVRPSNAIQWQMMRDSLAEAAGVYDLRGITDTLDESDPHFGLIRFKLGTGGHAIEYVGEWDYPLRPKLARAFDLYLRRDDLRARSRARVRALARRPRRALSPSGDSRP